MSSPLYNVEVVTIITLLDDDFIFFHSPFKHGVQHLVHLILF